VTELPGGALLLLWNGVDPARRDEYERWHGREHVPERLGVPGMLAARRYLRVAGPSPDYLTVYAMKDTGVLSSPEYRRLLDHPTPWSLAMRPAFRGFVRLCGRRVSEAGGGLGGVAATATIAGDGDAGDPALAAALAAMVGDGTLLAARCVVRDAFVPEVPFAVNGAPPRPPPAGAVMVEATAEESLAAAWPRLGEALALSGDAAAPATLCLYRLAQAITPASPP
jgi:hypothetical protein